MRACPVHDGLPRDDPCATAGTGGVSMLSFALRALPVLLCATLLAGCAHHGLAVSRTAQVTEVQACAIGYDLARQIHDRVSPRRTVLLAPRAATACETHALDYLRRTGFRIDETGQGGLRFNIALSRLDPEIISAVAWIGDDLRIARSLPPRGNRRDRRRPRQHPASRSRHL